MSNKPVLVNYVKGSSFAIHTPTKAEYDKVSELLGYKWSEQNYSPQNDTCIDCERQSRGFISTYRNQRDYIILDASQFIYDNTELQD